MSNEVTHPQTDIAALFATDPLNLTREDLTAMIQRFRESRHLFNSGNMKAGSTKKVSSDVAKAAEGLNLKSLGL